MVGHNQIDCACLGDDYHTTHIYRLPTVLVDCTVPPHPVYSVVYRMYLRSMSADGCLSYMRLLYSGYSGLTIARDVLDLRCEFVRADEIRCGLHDANHCDTPRPASSYASNNLPCYDDYVRMWPMLVLDQYHASYTTDDS